MMTLSVFSKFRIAGLLLCFAVTTTLAGCADKPDETATAESGDAHADEHEHPTTLAGAMEALVEQKETIQKAFEAGTPDDAHDPLHEIGHTLESIPEMAAKESKLDEEGQAAVKAAVDDLFDSFTALDEVMHGGKEIAYADVGTKIEEALSVLKEKLAIE